MHALHRLWLRLQASLWFVPTLIVSAAVVLAVVLVDLQGMVSAGLADDWPRLFGAGAEGARGMLSAIATSVITVAGVVFSVTVVALGQASTQYSPRVLRNFMSDRPTQVALGVLVGVFVYCLVVLRTVRGDSAGAGFVPSLAVLGALMLALLSVAMLIFFIHHVASSIQASAIVGRIADETLHAIDRLFPDALGDDAEPDGSPPALPRRWQAVRSAATGHLVSVDADGLLEFAVRHRRVVRLAWRIGDFVVEGQVLAWLSGDAPVDERARAALCRLFEQQRERTVHQDAPYGVQQLVDVAVKALSPGINDPTTAVACIDQLAALLVRLAGRRLPGPYREADGELRVIAHGPRFDEMAALALDSIAAHARGDAQILGRLVATVDSVAGATASVPRRRALRERLAVIEEAVALEVTSPMRRQALQRSAERVARALSGARPPAAPD